MRCKCRYCDNKELDTKEAYCVTIKEKKYYFCNEEHYKLAVQRKTEEKKIKAEYDEIFELTKQIFGYEFAGYSLFRKELDVWEKLGTRQKIIAYLKENKDWLSSVMRKEFANDYNRMRYFSAIVSNKLHDFKPTVNIKEKQIIANTSFELFVPIIKQETKMDEQVLYDVEDDLI